MWRIFEEPRYHTPFAIPERGFAIAFENVIDRTTSGAFNLGVSIDERNV